MLYLQYLVPRTNLKARDRQMPLGMKLKKKLVNNEFDYLIALDIFSNWEKFYEQNSQNSQNRKQRQDEKCNSGEFDNRH